jgi:class 3 adenylate cyclase
MGFDEAGTVRALREHRAAVDPIVASHGGRIVKTTGDGMLFEFPSIAAAVECAIAVQKLVAERNTNVLALMTPVKGRGKRRLSSSVSRRIGKVWSCARLGTERRDDG